MQKDPRVQAVLEKFVPRAGLICALVSDRGGHPIAAAGDEAAMLSVAETHFSHGLSLQAMSRDAEGSTVLSTESGQAVRFESVGSGSYVLTMVFPDPMGPTHARPQIDEAKRVLNILLATSEPENSSLS